MHSRVSGLSRLPGRRRARRPAHRARASSGTSTGASSARRRGSPARAAGARPRGAARHRQRRRAGAVRHPRDHRPDRRRLALRGVQAALRLRSWSPAGRSCTATRSGSSPTTGILFSEESQKSAQFIQLCNRHDTPILFLQNTTGFMVGTRYEQRGIIKDGAKLINAVSNSTVPHITADGRRLVRRRQLRHGRARVQPAVRVHVAEPRIAVMGPKQLGGVMEIVARQKAAKLGDPVERRAVRADARGPGGPGRARVDRAVRDRPGLGRRDHRSP